MPVPGTLAQYVSKSGGNAYRGSVYADFQDEAWQATNIDGGQIARGVAGGPGLDAQRRQPAGALPRLHRRRRRLLKKDRAWWYAAYRDTEVAQRYAWLLDAAGDADGARRDRQAHLQPVAAPDAGRLSAARDVRAIELLPRRHEPADSDQRRAAEPRVSGERVEGRVQRRRRPTRIYVEARAGGYLSDAHLQSFKSTAPRIADTGANTVRGGSFAAERQIDRPQVNGRMSFMKAGWGGSHTFRIGGEYMLDHVDAPLLGYGNACNCVSTLNNGVPTQVQMLLGPNVSKNDLVTLAGFVDDTWRIGRRAHAVARACGWIAISRGFRRSRDQPGRRSRPSTRCSPSTTGVRAPG